MNQIETTTMQTRSHNKGLLLLTFLFAFAGTTLAQVKKDSVAALWEKKYEFRDKVMQVHECSNADVLVLSLDDKGAVVIRRLRPDGSLRWDSTYQDFEKAEVINYHPKIKEDNKGAFTFTLNTNTNRPYLGKIDSNGKLVFARPMLAESTKKQRLMIEALFIRDSLVICYGVKNGYFWEGKFRDSAVLKSEEMYELEKNSFLTDILINDKGEPVVVAKNGVFDKYGGGFSSLRVQKLNQTERKLQTITAFEGKNGRMLQLPNGNYAIVYDASPVFPQQKIFYALLDKELKLRINKPLFENTPGSSPSFIKYLGQGTLAVAGVKDLRNTLLLMDFDGNVKEELLLDHVKVMSMEQVFYSNRRMGYLYKYFVPTKAIDPAALQKKKLILFPVKS